MNVIHITSFLHYYLSYDRIYDTHEIDRSVNAIARFNGEESISIQKDIISSTELLTLTNHTWKTKLINYIKSTW